MPAVPVGWQQILTSPDDSQSQGAGVVDNMSSIRWKNE